MGDNLLIAKFPKNSTEEVRLQIVSYKGYDLIDLRVWLPGKDNGEGIPTRKGLSLNIELLPELKKAILALEEVFKRALDARGAMNAPGPH